MPSARLDDIEAAVERAVEAEEFRTEELAQIRLEVRHALEQMQASEQEEKDAIRKELAKLEDQEDRLIDMAAGGKVSSDKQSDRLEAVKLQKGALVERLTRTGARIQSGVETVYANVDLLENPRELYLGLPDTVRRNLLAAFFTKLKVYVSGGELHLTTERTEVNATLHAWQAQHRFELSAVEGEDECEHENRASRVSTGSPVVTLYRLTQSKGLSKPVLVGLTGFEPATP